MPIRLLSPQHWPSWLGLGFVWVLARLPYGVQMAIGAALGRAIHALAGERRRIVDINLGLCFPELSDKERETRVRDCLIDTGRGVMDMLNCWFAPTSRLAPRIEISGLEHLAEARRTGRGVLAFTAHTSSFGIGLRALSLHTAISPVYAERSNAVLTHVMVSIGRQWIAGRMIKSGDVDAIREALMNRELVCYMPDQHPASAARVEAPFFGLTTMTHAGTSELARATGAVVLPFFTTRRRDGKGYRVEIQPPLQDFPCGDTVRDITRVNQVIEAAIRQAPAEYLWVHRRFKNLSGRANPYNDDN